MRTDEELLKEISHILNSHPGLDTTNIRVGVEDGIVTLSGTVHSSIAKWMVREAVKHISDIKSINEKLEISVPIST